jgi:hypothetical protein
MAAGGKEVLMRRLLILIFLVPFAVGCGAQESGLAESEKALKNAGSSRVEMSTVDSEAPLGFSATGSIDYARDRGELLITINSADLLGSELRARYIGQTTYVGWMLLGKVRWLKGEDYDLTAAERFMPGPGGAKPDQLLGMLIEASEKIETLGNEEIRGVSTKHHRAHIDMKKLGDGVRDLPDKLVIDAWFDEGGLVRRLRLPDSDTSTTMIDLYDFGVEVDVEAPGAEEIMTEDELTRLAEKECAELPAGKRREESFACLMSGTDMVTVAPETEK